METTEKKIISSEEIALHYYEHSLNMCKEHIKKSISDNKKEQMALIIDKTESLFNNYIRKIENLSDDNTLKKCYEVEKIWKLELIEKIIKF